MTTHSEEWWAAWREQDFSWEGLKKHEFRRYPHDPIATHISGATNLQEYWLYEPRFPPDGAEGPYQWIKRTEDELRANSELVMAPDGREWHIMHLPTADARLEECGNNTKWKSFDWLDAQMSHQAQNLLKNRIEASAAIKSIQDCRAHLSGSILFDMQITNKQVAIYSCFSYFFSDVVLINVSFIQFTNFEKSYSDASFEAAYLKIEYSCTFSNSYFIGPVDFSGAIFLKIADFERCKFFKETNFSNAIFFDLANFDGCIVQVSCNFSESIIFSKLSFLDHKSELVEQDDSINRSLYCPSGICSG